MPETPLVVTTCNRKGGCFKTSGIFHLAGALAEDEKRVLLIDLDPQASLSQTFFGSTRIDKLSPGNSICGVFDEAGPPPAEEIIHATDFENIYVSPACDALTEHNHGRPTDCDWRQDAILQLIAEVGPEFDVVLLDTPPNLQLLTWAAMVASNVVFTPVIPEDYAAQGLVHVRRFVESVTQHRNPQLRWLGLLISMVQRVAVHKVYEGSLRTAYADLVFETTIPHATMFKEAVASRKPITHYKPKSPGAKAVYAFRDELLVRQSQLIQKQAAA